MRNMIDSLLNHAELMKTAGEVTLLPEDVEGAPVRPTCFFYHRTKRYNVTIAYRRQGDNSVVYGAAFCRPGDQFSKHRGREIALGRMETYNYVIRNPGGARWEVHESILDNLARQHFVPYVPDNFRP